MRLLAAVNDDRIHTVTPDEIPQHGRLVGIDFGSKRIGLAVSDNGQSIAGPGTTLSGSRSDPEFAGRITKWAAAQDAVGLIVGLPLNMDGSDSAQTIVTRTFAERMRQIGKLPVRLFDERLTTFAAEEMMAQARVPIGKRRQLRDAFAAQVILQSFLDQRGQKNESC